MSTQKHLGQVRRLELIIIAWLAISLIASFVKAFPEIDNCGKAYPIDYIFYTDLFCETKEW